MIFAAYAAHADVDNPLSALRAGERPEPEVPAGWVWVKVSHASLNRYDLFTLRGITAHSEGITFPIIMGNDGARRPSLLARRKKLTYDRS
jgi:NADPH:quinone reductase-like Zn-dependent oxidoreductase